MKTVKTLLIIVVILLTAAGCQKTLYSVAVRIEGGGRVGFPSDQDMFEEGTLISFTALPDNGWKFSGWKGSASGTDSNIAVKVLDNLTLTAEFEKETVDISVSTSGDGSLVAPDLSKVIFVGDVLSLEAAPDFGWEFSRWEGNLLSNENPVTVTAESSMDITAVFVRKTATLQLSVEGNGKIVSSSGSDTELYIGNMVQVTAEAGSDWSFSHWEGDAVSNDNPVSVEITSDVVLKAVFEKNYDMAWRLSVGDEILSSAAIGDDGTIYIGSENGRLTALTPEGRRRWIFNAESGIKSSPAVGSDGTVYVGSRDKNFYAVNSEGTEQWRIETEGSIVSSPAINADGTIYFGSGDRYLYAAAPDGTVLWKYKTGSSITSSPSIGSDGTIYFGSMDRYLYALTADGKLKWRLRTQIAIETNPALSADGTIYFGSADASLYAVSAAGRILWDFRTDGEIYSSPVIGNDGTVYIGSDDYYLYAVSSEGDELWKFKAGSIFAGSPLVGKSGTIYAGSDDHNLYAIEPSGDLKWKLQLGGSIFTSPAMGIDGSLIVGSLDGKIYSCITNYETGLADSSWPKARGGYRNDGMIRE
ncbi:MAG: PQQ-like beta-propeller repeat protein [Bacteroidetes bacterium]|nr:PQQ-like beta-propeller repeat protein [Bacteroidota bacterium]